MIVIAVACDRSDQVRAALDDQRGGWTKRIDALAGRADALGARLRSLPAPQGSAGDLRAVAKRRRVQASAVGVRNTVADLRTHLTDGEREVERALQRGVEEGEQALADLAARMNDLLQQQEQGLAADENALLRIQD